MRMHAVVVVLACHELECGHTTLVPRPGQFGLREGEDRWECRECRKAFDPHAVMVTPSVKRRKPWYQYSLGVPAAFRAVAALDPVAGARMDAAARSVSNTPLN